jgi:hypothetical protein
VVVDVDVVVDFDFDLDFDCDLDLDLAGDLDLDHRPRREVAAGGRDGQEPRPAAPGHGSCNRAWRKCSSAGGSPFVALAFLMRPPPLWREEAA